MLIENLISKLKALQKLGHTSVCVSLFDRRDVLSDFPWFTNEQCDDILNSISIRDTEFFYEEVAAAVESAASNYEIPPIEWKIKYDHVEVGENHPAVQYSYYEAVTPVGTIQLIPAGSFMDASVVSRWDVVVCDNIESKPLNSRNEYLSLIDAKRTAELYYHDTFSRTFGKDKCTK